MARAQGRTVDDLLTEDASSFTTRILSTHSVIAVRTAPLPLVLTGLLGALIGALLVWFGLYQRVALQLPSDWLDLLGLALFLDVLAVVIILAWSPRLPGSATDESCQPCRPDSPDLL